MASRTGRNSRKSARSKSRTTAKRSRSGASRSSSRGTARSRGKVTASRKPASRSRSSRSSVTRARTSSASNRVLTGHEEIQQWAEERGAQPACVRGTGSEKDAGMIRLDFTGYSGEQSLEQIEWEDWFQKFDENNLALLVQDTTASGERSNFNKLVGRETAEGKIPSRHAARSASGRGGRRRAA